MDPEDPKRFEKERGSDPEDDPKLKALRHRFYRLGKHGPGLLEEMGFDQAKDLSGYVDQKAALREFLFVIIEQGRMGDLEKAITKKEAEILEQIGHQGNPCIHCGMPADEVKPGPCPVRKKMVATKGEKP